jgi:hypothetical protein
MTRYPERFSECLSNRRSGQDGNGEDFHESRQGDLLAHFSIFEPDFS